MALETLFNSLKQEKASEGFANLVHTAMESAIVRDTVLEELSPEELAKTDPEQLKDEMIDDDDMEALLDKIPETEIDDAAVAASKISGGLSDVSPDEYIGAPLEACLTFIDENIPDTKEV